ncbi:hypothetical protein DPEC_G00181410 [Dallia pectoralis]|uniref:Uncharacterized protein n=1 Tax=Dallia pectoralis TaxID=75939 RepID=A0ACC2GAF6_DALPE|nr:hypothetical protein DPEC_G00181410 [Dallia pectoralis]
MGPICWWIHVTVRSVCDDGLLMIAMNKHREICSIQSSGGIMLLKDQNCVFKAGVCLWLLRCSKIASVKVSEITELISKALENDKKIRKAGGRVPLQSYLAQVQDWWVKVYIAPGVWKKRKRMRVRAEEEEQHRAEKTSRVDVVLISDSDSEEEEVVILNQKAET